MDAKGNSVIIEAYINSQTLWQHAQGLQHAQARATQGPETKRGMWTQAPPWTNKLSATDTCWQKKKISFSQWGFTGYINYTPSQASKSMPSSSWTIQNKLNGIFIDLFVSFCFIWAFFCRIDLLLVYFYFHFCGILCVCFLLFCFCLFLKKRNIKTAWKPTNGKWGYRPQFLSLPTPMPTLSHWPPSKVWACVLSHSWLIYNIFFRVGRQGSNVRGSSEQTLGFTC